MREAYDLASPTYLSGSDPVAASRHGRVVGFYIPVARDEDEVRRALARLGETVGQLLEETGRPVEELAQMFDLRRRHAE